MLIFAERYLGAAGIVPQFLSGKDPRPAVEQIDTAYAHGGGWREFAGFTLVNNGDETEIHLVYPGEPPMRAKAYARLRDELIVLFDLDWCAIIQPDGAHNIARLD